MWSKCGVYYWPNSSTIKLFFSKYNQNQASANVGSEIRGIREVKEEEKTRQRNANNGTNKIEGIVYYIKAVFIYENYWIKIKW